MNAPRALIKNSEVIPHVNKEVQLDTLPPLMMISNKISRLRSQKDKLMQETNEGT